MEEILQSMDYESYYSSKWSNEWYDMERFNPTAFHLKRHIKHLLRSCHDIKSILDCGCGAGFNMLELCRHFPNIKIHGSDLTQDIVDLAVRNCAGLNVGECYVINLEEKSLSTSFDFILLNQVLEHIEHDSIALRNLYAMTNRYLLITVPGGSYNETSKLNGHFRHYSKMELVRKVQDAGFQVRAVYEYGWPMHSLYKWCLNLIPSETQKQVGYGRYGLLKKLIAYSLRATFYLNLFDKGENVILLAEK